MASVDYGMRVTGKADDCLYQIEQELKRCKVTVDADSFANARFYLDKIYSQLVQLPLAQAQAVAKAKA